MPEAHRPRDPGARLAGEDAPSRGPALTGTALTGTALTGMALLPLRCFLAVTFLYAGLQKLANPAFLDWSSPYSLHALMGGYATTSPIGGLVRALIPVANAVGILIALAELAVGIGMALGLYTKVAAAGGMLVSLTLFLVVSFHTHPWYTGSDIVFLFAFTPFVLAGAGGVLSVDAWLARRPVAASGDLTRRGVLVAGAATTLGVVVALADAALGRLAGRSVASAQGVKLHTTTGSAGATGPSGGTKVQIGAASDVPVAGSGTFTIPAAASIPSSIEGEDGLVIQPEAGTFVAYDAVCPHLGCIVYYDHQQDLIACPCHGSTFAVATGERLGGPAPHGLTKLPLAVEGGDLYLT